MTTTSMIAAAVVPWDDKREEDSEGAGDEGADERDVRGNEDDDGDRPRERHIQ